MTTAEFKSLKEGDKVKNGFRARPRTVTYVFDDRSGARIVNTSAIQGCTKVIDNLEFGTPSHYSEWRLA